MEPKTGPIRVLIVDDTLFFRELLTSIFQEDPTVQVVGVARDGFEAVRLVKRLNPDVITMDIHMPHMDGLEATRQIMNEIPKPIVVISASLNRDERDITFDALKAGALSVLEKPTLQDPPEAYKTMIAQVKLMSEVKVVRHWQGVRAAIGTIQSPVQQPKESRYPSSTIELLAIASSTGGPAVLAEILSKLPADFPVPVLIVQHITPGFSQGLADWLNEQTPLQVRLAAQADELKPGLVLIAPDGHHMQVNSMGLISLNQAPPCHGLRPSADYLFNSVARSYGANAIGVILTGMGSDGAEGLQTMYHKGARTIAQDEATCVVFGMPAVAIELGAVEQILPIQKITPTILEWIQAQSPISQSPNLYFKRSH